MDKKVLELREHFVQTLGEDFDDVQFLSLVISFVNKGENSHGMAQMLIDKYNGLHNVLSLDTEKLKLEGIPDHTAMMLESVYSTMSYVYDRTVRREKFNEVEKIGKFFLHKYIGVSYEKLYLALYDANFKMIDCIAFDNGSVNQTYVPPGKIAQIALSKKAVHMVIAHNHPEGIPVPSETDIHTTKKYAEMGNSIGVNLIEHILVASGKYTPVMLYMNERNQIDTSLIKYSNSILMAVDKLKRRGIGNFGGNN